MVRSLLVAACEQDGESSAAKKEEILRLRKQGMIIREIAKRVGCSYDVARLFLLNQKKT
jgi:transposase